MRNANRATAARKMLRYLKDLPQPKELDALSRGECVLLEGQGRAGQQVDAADTGAALGLAERSVTANPLES